MRYLILIFTLFVVLSCKRDIVNNDPFSSKVYDEIVFYRIYEKTENSLWNETLNPIDKKTIENLVLKNDYIHLKDSTIISQLDKYFKSFLVDENSYSRITDVFEKAGFPINKASFSMTFCAPVYRDVLVFKNNSKIVGFAKICFSCSQNMVLLEDSPFVDTPLNYSELKIILDNLVNRF